MGMLQMGGDPDLLEEPLGAEHGGELGLEDLNRDLATVLAVVGEIDDRACRPPRFLSGA
jgi:hypothetical protein